MERTRLTGRTLLQALESMNREATTGAIKGMRGRLEAARATMSLMTGYAVEVHRQIKVDAPLPVTEFRIGAALQGQE